MPIEHVLAIETSCDDTSVAIVREDGFVVQVLAANQDSVHRPFGGVVPEIASRNHTLQILPLIDTLLNDAGWGWDRIDGIAVTSRPGLLGSLIVGVVAAKTLALVHGKPLIGVNHLEAHLLAPFLHDNEWPRAHDLSYPFLALAVSGGHTQLYNVESFGRYSVLGRTVDDAAGEAFDKFAKHLGLGFPGGVKVDRLAQTGKRDAFHLPRTSVRERPFDFSFSGLKSAAVRMIDGLSAEDRQARSADLCASFQEAVVDSLMDKLKRAADEFDLKRIVLTGGVSANSRLRAVAAQWAESSGRNLFVPPLRYCTDNAAMVGFLGAQKLKTGHRDGLELAPSASSYAGDFQSGPT